MSDITIGHYPIQSVKSLQIIMLRQESSSSSRAWHEDQNTTQNSRQRWFIHQNLMYNQTMHWIIWMLLVNPEREREGSVHENAERRSRLVAKLWTLKAATLVLVFESLMSTFTFAFVHVWQRNCNWDSTIVAGNQNPKKNKIKRKSFWKSKIEC